MSRVLGEERGRGAVNTNARGQFDHLGTDPARAVTIREPTIKMKNNRLISSQLIPGRAGQSNN